jgi:hypothetical protein
MSIPKILIEVDKGLINLIVADREVDVVIYDFDGCVDMTEEQYQDYVDQCIKEKENLNYTIY